MHRKTWESLKSWKISKPELWIRWYIEMRGKRRLSSFDLVDDESGNDMHKHIGKRAMPRILEHESVFQIIEHSFD